MGFNRSEEITKREVLAKDFEIRLKTITTSFDVVDKEINSLNASKLMLELNMDILRKDTPIPSVFEFKKNKEELSKIINRLSLLLSDRIKLERAIRIIKRLIEENNQEHLILLQNAGNVILSGHFGENKDGQK